MESQPHRDLPTRLLLRAGHADREAFERLHAALLPAVRDYLGSLDGSMDYHQREDLVQEVFFRAWKHLGRFRGNASAKTFVFTIAKRVLREERLRHAKLPIVPIDDFDHFASTYLSDPSASQTDPDQTELFEKIRQAVAGLPDVQREAFELAYFQNMQVSEAAKGANCSIQQFWDRLRRARRRLRQLLRNLPRWVLP